MAIEDHDIPLNLDEEALTGSGLFHFKLPEEVKDIDVEPRDKQPHRTCRSHSEMEEQEASFAEWSAITENLNETSSNS